MTLWPIAENMKASVQRLADVPIKFNRESLLSLSCPRAAGDHVITVHGTMIDDFLPTISLSR